MNRPSVGSIFWFLAFCGVSYFYYQSNFAPKPVWASQIMFDKKFFFDTVKDSLGFVGASGTMTGAGIAYPNNTYAIHCVKDRKECWIASIEQIGPNQIGRLSGPYAYPITRWDAREIVAQDESLCMRTTLNLLFASQAVVMVEEPINQTSAQCRSASTTIQKYVLDDSMSWKALHSRTK